VLANLHEHHDRAIDYAARVVTRVRAPWARAGVRRGPAGESGSQKERRDVSRPDKAVGTTEATRAAYEVYALRFAKIRNLPASAMFPHYHVYGVEDQLLEMDFFFWLIRNDSHVVLLDCGWSPEFRAGFVGYDFDPQRDQQPLELLARLDVSAESVDHVVLSHMHSDHIGNVDLFPNATFSVAKAELDCWAGPMGDRPAIAHATQKKEVQAVQRLERDGRLRFVAGSEEILPGLSVMEVSGHTPGQLITEVATGSGSVVLTSDASHYREEFEQDRPFMVFTDLVGMLRTYDVLRELAARPRTTVVTGHDPLEMDRFERVNEDCIDLTKPIR
jgi:glyoxylase-like metal-dependent hydrolase (beta-lactamase superfamily II)